MYKHVLIPTDGSERSARAITQGIALAALLKARVTAFMATPPIPPIVLEGLPAPVHNEELEQNAKDYATRSLAIAAEAAAAAGVPCEAIHIKHDHPWEAIIQAAEQRGCDLIVMASHGRRGIAKFVLGSQATRVLSHSTVPMLICR